MSMLDDGIRPPAAPSRGCVADLVEALFLALVVLAVLGAAWLWMTVR